MLNRKFATLVSALLLASTTACGTTGDPQAASATDRPRSSWCQGDRELSYVNADTAGQDDLGNVLDSDETVEEIQAHNARYRAACSRN